MDADTAQPPARPTELSATPTPGTRIRRYAGPPIAITMGSRSPQSPLLNRPASTSYLSKRAARREGGVGGHSVSSFRNALVDSRPAIGKGAQPVSVPVSQDLVPPWSPSSYWRTDVSTW